MERGRTSARARSPARKPNLRKGKNRRHPRTRHLDLIEKTPFPIKPIQVDGISKFIGEFYQTFTSLKITLIVLPPTRPKYNGGRRARQPHLQEFCYCKDFTADTITDIRLELEKPLTNTTPSGHKKL